MVVSAFLEVQFLLFLQCKETNLEDSAMTVVNAHVHDKMLRQSVAGARQPYTPIEVNGSYTVNINNTHTIQQFKHEYPATLFNIHEHSVSAVVHTLQTRLRTVFDAEALLPLDFTLSRLVFRVIKRNDICMCM
jgi:hypothetical protein